VKPGRHCSVCRHPDLAEIEAALRAGTPLRALAAAFATSAAALHRHRTKHMVRIDLAEPVGAVLHPAGPIPSSVSAPVRQCYRLLRPHGFIGENGRRHHWGAGDIVSDPCEVAMLQGRKAPLELLG
jgi:hypothetical protein